MNVLSVRSGRSTDDQRVEAHSDSPSRKSVSDGDEGGSDDDGSGGSGTGTADQYGGR